MARLEVCATIYPTAREWLLVGVEDSNGTPVNLTPASFYVELWAQGAIVRPSIGSGAHCQVAELIPIFDGALPGHFYSVRLADLANEEEGQPGTPIADFDPLAYGVTVTSAAGDQGMAIATLPT
jgi:hypothetical protein